MAGYLGYALQAGVQGFQSGFNMAQKKSEMDWQKKQKKKLEQKEAELLEASTIFNGIVATAGEDGFYSEDEKLKINTAYMALAYEVKGRVDGTYKAIQAMDQKTTEANYQWFDFLTEGVKGLDAKNVEALFDFVEPNITGEKGLQMFEARKNMEIKKVGIAKEEQTWERGRTVPSENRAEWFRQQGIDIPVSVADKKFNLAMMIYEKNKNVDMLLRYLGMDVTPEKKSVFKEKLDEMDRLGITTEEKKKWILGEGGGGTTPTEPKSETVGTLKSWEKMFDINAEEGPRTEEEYNRALDLLAQSEDRYKPKYATWKEALVAEVKGIGKELEGITDRTDRLFLLDVYKRKLEEIKTKYPDVDLSQFSQPKGMSGWDKFLEGIGF
jgi:hypothetical protein